MPLTPDSVETLMQHLHELVGQTVTIRASLSRDRDGGGHNRHVATSLQFSMVVETSSWLMSGMQLFVAGAGGAWYGMAAAALVDWTRNDDGSLTITEQFEAQTERRTEIVPAATAARQATARRAHHERLGIALPEARSDEPAPPAAS